MQAHKWPPRPNVLEKKFNTHYTGKPVSFQSVSAWLGGRSMPKNDKLRALADLLGVEMHVLCFGGGPQPLKVREKPAAWLATLNESDRAAVEALLALPAQRRKLVNELIKTLMPDGRSQ